MQYTRREFGKIALATAPAVALFEKSLAGAALAQAKPNSKINGVQIGTITYSFRSMPDKSVQGTLTQLLGAGISAVEIEADRLQEYLGLPGGRGGGAAPAAAAGGRAGAAPAGAAGAAAAPGGAAGGGRAGGGGGGRGPVDPATLTSSWNGVPCAPAQPNVDNLAAAGAAPAARAGGAGAAGRGAAAGGRAAQTPEQLAAAQDAASARRKALLAVSMDKVKALRKMYSDAGVTIYATKMLNTSMSDDEVDQIFNIAAALGATHTTLELTEDEAQLKRLGTFALKHKVYVAYHTHLQGSITVFDKAFAASEGNRSNVDLGHYVAGGGDPIAFLNKFHDKISSFHMKDRTTPAHCALNLPWGTGETPLKQILKLVQKNKWTMPATIELEYQIPAGSDAVKEVSKCLQYCRDALTT